MKILVIGSGGRLGSELCRRGDADVVGLDLPELDLADRLGVLDVLDRARPEVIVNTAAYTQVDKAQNDAEPCRAVNADGVAHLVEACRRLDAVLVQVSTDYVFGRDVARRTPYVETDEPGPLSVYGQTKLEGEGHAAGWPKHFIVRTCGLYGGRGPRTAGSFVDTMLELGGSRRTLRVVDDQHCTPSYVPHVARAVRFLLGTTAYGTYHVVNRGQTTWFDLAAEAFRLAGREVRLQRISTAEYGAAAPRPAYSVLDPAKYDALPGRPEMPSWQDALAEYVRLQ